MEVTPVEPVVNDTTQGAARVASAVAQSVRYQGRKASRRGSEQRRQAILDAAMRIVIRDGVRGVRHRAVAAEADVPLSATTYYFKDIDDLLNDAFAQYVERSAVYLARLWQNTEVILRDMLARNDGSPAGRQCLTRDIARMIQDYIEHQLQTRRDQLIAEYAFYLEALINPRLALLVADHQQILFRGACQFLQVLGSAQPQQDAEVLTGMIRRMEYQGLLQGLTAQAASQREALLTRQLQQFLGAAATDPGQA
ncbi:TetR family transcriptional regulator [Pseudomonas sp. DTU_2021_1001937_2_SI_NGA_ILE_001]|uniref:TetR/AcrR family transcriptional regulator n=1 Tax=Pseudomonas sp. DTU_2021_1001937_2_SI_NGA_ILE_001 TaxID=3077589 RepID=UPI0028FC0AC6|nr:TetR family transcriptional regulator [Pseudomonas sp. DTU_2021_1001937_2_SI_NGA_ILE_001]WNW11387.1 TetR family transcriptional regulator [Pseudomonas sp. DTU_2021_1001937_2_SI_NGA_ILE_001]